MEFLIDFPKVAYLPVDDWIDDFVLWLAVAGADFFEVITAITRSFLLAMERGLLWLPWVVVVAVLAALAWRVAGWRLGAGVAAGLAMVGVFGLWDLAMSTLAIVLAATVMAVLFALPIGIAMAKSDILDRVVRPLLDLMQTMPSFVYLIPAIMFFELGRVPALIATFIYAVPPAIRLTNLGIRQVAPDVVEAAHAFGVTSSQLLFKVQLPLALPTIMAGINQTIMMALAMVVIASMIGAGGLGQEVLNGIARLETGRGFVAGMGIVVLAIIIDRISQQLARSGRAAAREG